MLNRFSAAAAVLAFVVCARALPAGRAAPDPERRTVGADACASCHQGLHAAWKEGRHGRMVQPASPASVVADFSRDGVTLRGSRYRFRVANGEFFITESYLTGKPQEHRIEYTLGSRRIQHYLTTLADGRIIILPPSWDVRRQQWFHNLDIVRPDEDGHTLVQQWNKSCVGCHVSEEQVEYSPATRSYTTRWMDFGTSCERCHGPGSEHVQQYAQSRESRPAGQRSIVRPTRLDPATSSTICAQCHSLREAIAPGFKAGDPYDDYFVPVLESQSRADQDPAYWPDGRPRRFSNDAVGLWQSACFLRGGATCTSCHNDPHLPDVDRNAQLAPGNNALCTQCHRQIGEQLTAHSHHRADSAGSSCVECHMPRTVVSIKATMRDHTISVPAPENTTAFGIPNACAECHADKKPRWAVDVLAQWWPERRRSRLVTRAEAFTGGRAARPDALDRLIAIADDAAESPFIRANALGYLRNYRDARATTTLVGATRAAQPIVRSTAISSLALSSSGTADGSGRAAALAGLDDPRRSVRLSALAALINEGGGQFSAADEERFRRVGREFAGKASLFPDNGRIQAELGVVRLLSGDVDGAADALVNSRALEPDRQTTTFLLAMARLGQHRVDDARALLAAVPPSDPYYKAAQERLKTLATSAR